ncbi:MAG: diaminopimelate epimerase, partial [Akkermansiaceae bacterium]
EQVAKMCDRNFGIGADGVIIVKPTAKDAEVSHLLDQEPEAVWFMDYRVFNSGICSVPQNSVFCRCSVADIRGVIARFLKS